MDEETPTSIVVDEDGIRVEKSFTRDAFPVPAMTFDVSSAREKPARVRLIDEIPEAFPMDKVGFHPEHESEHWTAYKNNRVEFERTIDPGETIHTVFGIREDDPDVAAFLTDPTIEHVPVGEEITDVLGPDNADVVREALASDRETLARLRTHEPGEETRAGKEMQPTERVETTGGPDEAGEATTAAGTAGETVDEQESVPSAGEAGGLGVGEEAGGPGVGGEAGEPGVREEAGEPGVREEAEEGESVGAVEEPVIEPTEEATEAEESEEPEKKREEAKEPAEPAEEADETDETNEPAEPELAAEAEEPTEPAETPETPPDETDPAASRPSAPAAETPTTETPAGTQPLTDAEITAALASAIRSGDATERDIQTLRAALGTETTNSVDVRLNRLQSRVSDLDAYTDALAAFIDENGTATEVLDQFDGQVESLTATVDELDTRLTATERAHGALAADLGTLRQDLAAIELELTEASIDTDAIESTLDSLEDRMATLETQVTDSVDSVDTEIDAIHAQLEELEAFRERLNEALGP